MHVRLLFESPAMLRHIPPLATTSASGKYDKIFSCAHLCLVLPCDQNGGVNVSKTGRWVVSLNLAGEMYQALFETQVGF